MDETSQNFLQTAIFPSTFNPISQLDLIISSSNKQDQEQLVDILTKILTYPDTQLAKIHMSSDKLGKLDLRKQVNQRNQLTHDIKEKNQLQFCSCCGFVKQNQQLRLCTRLAKINNIGISTFLYFETIKNLIILLAIMTIIYSIYAFVTNLIASQLFSSSNTLANVNYVSLSLGSKDIQTSENQRYYLIQCWLGVAFLCIWLIMIFVLKYIQRQKEIKTEIQTISAADFTILIQNIPKDITKDELQTQLNSYYQKLKGDRNHFEIQPFQIAKISVGRPFYLNEDDYQDQQLARLKKKHKELAEEIVDLIKQRKDSYTFSTTKQQRQQLYNQYKSIVEQQYLKYNELGEKIIQKMRFQTHNQQLCTSVFVTFQLGQSMKVMTRYNDPSIISIIQYYLTCKKGQHRFKFVRGNQKMRVKIQRAPEPEDVIWTNLGVPNAEIIKRKAITFTSTILLLGISFVIAFALSTVQHNQSQNQILSLAISVCISLMNIIIGLCIRQLSIYQKDYTLTKYQTSLAIKSILASLINSIIIPILVNNYIKQDIYGKNGLASDVFMLGLTNSFLSPILKIIDFSYILNRLNKWWTCKPYNKIYSTQRELNNSFQYMVFEVGYQYVYLVSLFIFTSFFVSLQPIISLFAICGMGLMYWTQKYSLFNKMKRPVPGTNLVNVTMFQIMLFSGLSYSLGNLTWSYFMPEKNRIPSQTLLPNLIAVGISVGLILMPYTTILSLCLREMYSSDLQFSKSRILLPSQYDRLNPIQSQKALKQFKQFYSTKINEMQNVSEKDKNNFFQLLFKQGARGQHKHHFHSKQNPFNLFLEKANQSNRFFQMTSKLVPTDKNNQKDPRNMKSFMELFLPTRKFGTPNYFMQYQQQPFRSSNPILNLLSPMTQHMYPMNRQRPPIISQQQTPPIPYSPKPNFTQIYPNKYGGTNLENPNLYPQNFGFQPPPNNYQGIPMQPNKPFSGEQPPFNNNKNFDLQQPRGYYQ